jgi:CO/xanthine dehydrogenase Mo-binding subunit
LTPYQPMATPTAAHATAAEGSGPAIAAVTAASRGDPAAGPGYDRQSKLNGESRGIEPDTDTSPFDTRTTSSRTTHMMGRALEAAVRDLRTGGGERGYGEIHNEGGLDPDTGQGIASTHWHQGAAAAHVAVDEETGQLTVERLHGVAYAGRVVNGKGAELQNEGSLIMGLGTALFEAIDFADGQVTNANLSDYNMPSIGDLPKRFTHEIIEREGAEVHGLGETVLPPVPAAIGNALYSLGLELYELPMSAERVLAAIDAREGRA